MARALRIERPAGRYHVTSRGNEQKPIYRDDPDRAHCLELLGEATERFGIRVHAYVLMDNHYHLLIETPEANLSRAMQWLNVSYSLWFNRRHHRVGHLFQGRFSAVVVEDDAGWQEVARYVHLNPVRVSGLGLGKRERAASRAGAVGPPGAELVAKRLEQLRQFQWSSYRTYAGYTSGVGWLWRDPLEKLCGGRSRKARREAFRQYTEQPVRQGQLERPWDRLVAGLVLGSEAFARSLCRKIRGNAREQVELRKLAGRITWEQIVKALERVKGQSWTEFSRRHGDWGRDAALWLARKRGRYRLAELGRLAGGVDYAAVGQAVSRFGRRLEKQRELKRKLAETERQLSNVEM
jgi:putative transposase